MGYQVLASPGENMKCECQSDKPKYILKGSLEIFLLIDHLSLTTSLNENAFSLN